MDLFKTAQTIKHMTSISELAFHLWNNTDLQGPFLIYLYCKLCLKKIAYAVLQWYTFMSFNLQIGSISV